jgi:hypothetical protein
MASSLQSTNSPPGDWTVTRCNRLIRPIVSSIAALRAHKDRKELTSSASSRNDFVHRAAIKASSHPVKFGSQSTSFEEKENDPDWVSGPSKKKKAARHYSARAVPTSSFLPDSHVKGSILQPGELSIPTPYTSHIGKVVFAHNSQSTLPANSVTNIPAQFRSSTVGRPRSDQDKESDILNQRFISKTDNEQSILQNLAKSFLNLMNMTGAEIQKNFNSRGAMSTRSLFSTCCRAVPARMVWEDAKQLVAADEDRFDAPTEVYLALEDELETSSGHGWKNMYLVVRAHAVSLVRDAITERLIPRAEARTLIRHLLKPQGRLPTRPSPAEAEILTMALIAAETPNIPSKCCSRQNQFYANSFNNIASASVHLPQDSRKAFELRQLSNLLESPYIPAEWFATWRVRLAWNNTVRALADMSSDLCDAFHFLELAIAYGTGVKSSSQQARKVLETVAAKFADRSDACPRCPRASTGTFLTAIASQQPAQHQIEAKSQLSTAFTNTVSSLSTILSSLAIATIFDDTERQSINFDSILWTLNNLVLDIFTHHKVIVTQNSHHATRRSAYLVASVLITRVVGCSLGPHYATVDINDLVRLIESLDREGSRESLDEDSIIDALPELVCSIAQGSSQIAKIQQYTGIQCLVRAMNTPSVAGTILAPASRSFMRRLALSSALEFARQHKSKESYALVQEIEGCMTRSEISTTDMTPARCSTKQSNSSGGFRWEEGICEWVAATPIFVPNGKAVLDSPIVVIRRYIPNQGLPEQHPPPSSPATTGVMAGRDGDNRLEYLPSPVTSPRLCERVQPNISISDLLPNSSSPVEATARGSMLERQRPSMRKRAHSLDSSPLIVRKKSRNAAIEVYESDGEELEADETTESSSLTGSRSLKVVSRSPRRARQPSTLKHAPSSLHSVKDDSDDELGSDALQPSRKRQSVSRITRHITRRNPRGTHLRSMPATSHVSAWPAHRSLKKSEIEDDDDELSFEA